MAGNDKKDRSVKAMVQLQAGSFLSQTIQVGAFPLLLTKRLLELGSDTQTIGHMSSISWVLVLILGPFVPKILRHFTNIQSNAITLAATLLSLGMLFIAKDLAALFLAAALMGCALILRWILCDVMIVQQAPRSSTGRYIGIHEALMGFGIACGPLIVFFTNTQWAIALSAMCMVISGALLVMAAKSADRPKIDDEPIATLYQPAVKGFGLVLIVPLAAMAILASMAGGFIESSTNSLFPVAANTAQIDFSWAVFLVSVFGFGGTLLQPALGWLADKKGYFYAQIACLLSIIALSLLIMLTALHAFWLAVFMFLLGGAAGGLNTLAVIQFGQTQSDANMASAMTLIAMTYTFGSVLGPNVSGILIEKFNFDGIFLSFGAVAIIIFTIIILRNFRHKNRKSY